ncbi:hypothetical protein QNB55_004251 [Salmonella enterica]|uniref:hypothetical protein n=1 Tax=Salmonella enterica TaxID=28901 RepID=UPI000BA13422|nr:hypothetical protein [Salmonella enterica]EBV7253167.1 hypothetical protein [Salmonella enterica subsp. enterica serovar Pomona]EGA8870622.1 hypothetical protein [Salmonella enterica subsp. enterica serovar Oranienburg]EHM1179744.1 hypothetical protein [Salmonella enterica subsp. enterica serovar Urbana]EAW7736372.1 hypothetical protein [Salmonella enterica]EEJ1804097.1 hypothetical protein [Salmonella enterica subsp. enterica serovar Pomona]
MTLKKVSLLAVTILMSTGVFAANLAVKTQNLTADIKSQASINVQWTPTTIFATGMDALNRDIGVMTINSSHLSKISIVSNNELYPRNGIITFYKQGQKQWLIANIKPETGVDIKPILKGFELTPSNGQATIPGLLTLQLYAEFVSNGGGANGDLVTAGSYAATVNITTEIG